MDMTTSYLPLAAILISLLGAVPILLSGRLPNLREGWTLAIALGKFALVATMLPTVLAGGTYVLTLAEVIPGVPIALRVDAMGIYFALIASFLWIFTSIYSMGYMRALKEHNQTRYYASFAVAISATIGVAFSANLLTLYLFYEMLSLSTYPLVTHHGDAEARRSGRKYLTYILGTSIGLVLPAMLITYQLTGTLDFAHGGILSGEASSATLGLLLVLFVLGFAKAGIMPFHGWLPAAMVAPTPVSAFLHGVAVVKVGVFAILRVIFDIFGPDLLHRLDFGVVLTYFASVTILAASLVALTQDNLKRRLAYSTIGQLSYMILGAGMLSAAGMTGGMLHIAMHAFGKITLFFCAGAIYVASHKKYISEMDGLGRRMPITYFAFFLGSLSIIGMPPLGGFISKWNLVIGAVEADQLLLVAVLLVSSLLSAAYFFPIVYRGFFAPASEETLAHTGEAPLLCLIPLSVTALCSVGLFFYPDIFLQLVHRALFP
ncbi:multisubunit sodium/proton antiporter, MrpD subunit [Desulfuromonas soudanensis]|uniref:Multisubunit sodium/proton antiporter, MrpD subunit n=1 Tax=Desulfuromonas soudanensis TaxID=1603606 RepID=A0A0M4CZT5_9BACT|nr:monovalent cation/H+ antiporter subunit D family protein [Desulfuromonas soudanensis]ALC14976.1 multisubunit sodium/proton antiporter, MrpD subunit [Desulfuromonas soudanensis]